MMGFSDEESRPPVNDLYLQEESRDMETMTASEEITALLVELAEGRTDVWDELMASVYDELRRLARGRLRYERRGHTFSTTALVHEAYLKLVDLDRIQWENRAQFFAVASTAMRRILIDHARAAKRLRRGGGRETISLEERGDDRVPAMSNQDADDLLALDAALERLSAVHERQQQVVELRFFGGLTLQETADVLGVGLNTVKRDWSTARAWLNRELGAA